MEARDIIAKLRGNRGQQLVLLEEQRLLIVELAKQLGEHLWENYKLVYDYYSFGQLEINRDYTLQEIIPTGYRLPSLDEYQILIDSTVYSFDEKTNEGVFMWHSGYELRFPTLGYYREENAPLIGFEKKGAFWSATSKDSLNSYFLAFDNGRTGPYCINDERAFKCPAICIKQLF